MKKVRLAMIGAGDRGFHCYAPYALEKPYEVEFTAIAEMDDEKRTAFAEQFNIPPEYQFKDYNDLLNAPRLADGILICTGDRLHVDPAMKAMEKGYHIMMEKPMAPDLKQCIELWNAAENYNRTFILCFVLRYTEFFQTIKKILDEERIGKVNSINHMENIPLTDQVHSFTRGIFSTEEKACPIIVGHCCHDLDLISWYASSRCTKVASFGSLSYFKEENAPEGAPLRCLNGCPYDKECPYYAPDYYLTEDVGWPTSTIGTDMSFEGRLKALEHGPYGRCVYHCDNNVCDNQTVIMEFENGVTGNFSLQPFARENSRTLKITGTKGELRADMDKGTIEIFDIKTERKEILNIVPSKYKYGGGDHGIMEYFIDQIKKEAAGGLTCMDSSVEAHLIAYAAERSRKNNVVVDLEEMRKGV